MKMKSTDVIKVQVFSDGDCELTKLPGVPQGPARYKFLYFPITEVSRGALDKELLSYGHEQERVKETIDSVLVSNYYEPVKV